MTLYRLLRMVYTAALAIAGPLLLAGLALGAPALLEAGVLVVMTTPVVGVVIVAGAMVKARDWTYAAVALAVIAILGSSLYAAAHVRRARADRPPVTGR
jgi:uncharacterized membrane protein